MELVLRVRAAGDSSLTTVFRPWVAAAVAAERQVEAATSRSGKATQSIYRENARAAAQAAETSVSAAEKKSKAEEAAAKRGARAWQDFFEQQRRQRAGMEAEERAANARMGSAALRTFGGLARVGMGALRTVAGGLGVDVDPASLLHKAAAAQLAAADVAGYGYIKGASGAAGVHQDPEAIERDARAAAKAGALRGGSNEALAGLAEFTKRSSELALGREMAKDIAEYSRAMGVNFVDVAATAGDIAKKLGDVPNKAQAVMSMIRTYGIEGKYGAIDMADMAKLIPTVIGGANQFAEGSASAMTKLGVALQVVKSLGGAKNPAQAATSVSSFVGDLTSKAGLKSLTAAGIDPFADKGKTKLKGIDDIIVEALQKSGGDLSKMSAMFSNKRSGSVLKGFGQIFSEAGGGEKGAAAVRETFKSYGAGGPAEDVKSELAKKMATTDAQVALFNQEMEDIARTTMADFAPALKELAPVAKDAAKGLADLVSFGAQHPGLMITGAIVASIGKAAIGDAVGKAIGGMLGNGLAALGPTGAALGVLAIAAAAAAAAISDYQDKVEQEKGKGNKDAALIAKAEKEFREKGQISKDTIDEIAQRRAEVEGQRAALKTGGVEQLSFSQILAAKVTGGADQVAGAEGATAAAKEAGADKLDALAGKMDQLIAKYGQQMHVHVDNAADMKAPAPGPAPNEAARSGGIH